jgi:hypothetical protein
MAHRLSSVDRTKRSSDYATEMAEQLSQALDLLDATDPVFARCIAHLTRQKGSELTTAESVHALEVLRAFGALERRWARNPMYKALLRRDE